MSEPIVYLDSSAVINRYIKGPGSSTVRELYLKAYAGEATLSFNIWNIGEVLGVLDKARSTGRITDEAYQLARKRFLLETRRLIKLGLMTIVLLDIRILSESWRLVEKHHIYEADAIQVASAKYINASHFLTGDKQLHEIAVKEGLNSIYLS
ncbi:type II toxin-antitoxin system VapC family toxin [Desulfurococcaceae archaeon MEX13E-LK6-19]|nr:type II toxin-antitoxin system VapC family toxin [Desulfurococcaceae archaeon MEX13E-LK6-19]